MYTDTANARVSGTQMTATSSRLSRNAIAARQAAGEKDKGAALAETAEVNTSVVIMVGGMIAQRGGSCQDPQAK